MNKSKVAGLTCSICGKDLTPEERLLSAIFHGVGPKHTCRNCYEKECMPKCKVCGKPTELARNGEPRCAEHMDPESEAV